MFANLHQLSHHHAWRRQLEMLLESAGDGIYGIDLGGRCIFINQAGASLLGYSPDEMLGRNMHYLIHHSRADHQLLPVHECRIFKAFALGESVRTDDEVLWRRDGTPVPVAYASYPIRDGERIVGAVVTFSDISVRRAAELALQQAHADLEQRVAERTAELQQAHTALAHSYTRLQQLSAHLQHAREEERRHIARNIHDDLGASLTALQLDMNWLQKRLGGASELQRKLDGMVHTATTAMHSLRRILDDLRPEVLDHLGLWAALEGLLQDFRLRHGLNCIYACHEEAENSRLSSEAEMAIYRIVQEALTNVGRHAQASEVVLGARVQGGMLLVQVHDNGRGLPAVLPTDRFGLPGMQERARILGGELQVHGEAGTGVCVHLRLPLPATDLLVDAAVSLP